MNKIPLIVITGPTASGKTALSIRLAKNIEGEVISADSAQLYKDLQIITDRVTEEQMQGVPHHLTGFLSLGEDYSVAQFQKDTYEIIKDIIGRKKIPIMVGGTFLYVKAVVEGYTFVELPKSEELRNSLNKRAEIIGRAALYEELKEKDPEAAGRIHPNNLRRVVRALEVIHLTGKRFSRFYKKADLLPMSVDPVIFNIALERNLVYRRIEDRVEEMFQKGALKEVENLVLKDKRKELEDSGILGVKEILCVLDGFCSLKEGIELLKRNTRRYAKRQFTWIKSMKNKIDVDKLQENVQPDYDKIMAVLKRNFCLFC